MHVRLPGQKFANGNRIPIKAESPIISTRGNHGTIIPHGRKKQGSSKAVLVVGRSVASGSCALPAPKTPAANNPSTNAVKQ